MEDDSLEDYIRILRSTKEEKPIIKKEVLVTALRKKECENKAMKMVEFMIDGRLRQEPFLKCLPYIDRSHYQDIVEERAIGRLCGYPLCGKRIPDMPKKQYHISSKSNKVYDITERKNYCSNYCYSASTHMKKQIDDSPLWLRKYETVPNFNLLDKKQSGVPGEEVLHEIARPVVEEPFTSVSSLTEVLLDEMAEKEIKPKSKSKPKKQKTPNMVTISESEEEDDLMEQVASINLTENEVPTSEPKATPAATTTTITTTRKSSSCSLTSDKNEIESKLKKCFKQWLTVDTLCFIHGEEKMKTVLDAHKMSDYFDTFKVAELEVEQQKRYAEICRRLHLRELAEEKFDGSITGNANLRPIPDYNDLKLKNKEIELKIKSYFSGELHEKSDTNFPEAPRQASQEEEEESTPRIMPLADVNSQKALRRRVFLNSVHKSMQTHARSLKIHSSIVSNVQGLVKTFNLSPDNVMFKPMYWNYITLTLLRILSLRDGALKVVLDEQRSMKYFQLNWEQLPGNGQFVDDIMEVVQDIDKFMRCVINEE